MPECIGEVGSARLIWAVGVQDTEMEGAEEVRVGESPNLIVPCSGDAAALYQVGWRSICQE